MSLLHERWRTRVSLLVSGCLDDREREATLRHLDRCEECRKERADLVELLEVVAKDPARQAEIPVPVQFLVKRVEARLDAMVTSPAWRWGWVAASLAIAAVVALIAPRIVTTIVPPGIGSAPSSPAAEQIQVSDDALRRLERNMAREHAARYLSEAQDVLVTVAASRQKCERGKEQVDVGEEARRSRELLVRSSLLVDTDREAVASAGTVLRDVEDVLREVASLESCARLKDLEAIHREIERRRLLMKIDLTTRELLG